MKLSEFTHPLFIEQLLKQKGQDIKVGKVTLFELDNSASILSALTSARTDNPIGHFGLEVNYKENNVALSKKMVLKVKPHGSEIVEMINSLAQACGTPLSEIYPEYKSLTGFQHCHRRELEIYEKLHSSLMPAIYGLYANEKEGVYIILMEYLDDVLLLNSVMEPEQWTTELIKQSLTQIAEWHALYLSKQTSLDRTYWDDAPSREYMLQLKPLWTAILKNASDKFPDLYTPENTQLLSNGIENIASYWTELEKLPKTLIHNDFNPRNSCFKLSQSSPELCLYDWELATFHIPQYDIVELLSFVLDEKDYSQRLYYLEFYRRELNKLTNLYNDQKGFEKGFSMATLDFGIHRLGMYMIAHAVSPYPYLSRVTKSYFDTLKQVKHLL